MNKELQDKAWSVLPKEFKEEVKRIYKNTEWEHKFFLRDIFGTFNLASDAEGEEMLMCDRNTVRMLYDRTDSVKVRQTLESLFGSKRLPDDTKDDTKEPKPAEPKEAARMKPIKAKVSVYLATAEEDEEFRQLLHENGFKWNSNRSLISLSCWSSLMKDNKIHYVHPDKTVTYCGKKTSDTLTFSEFKKQYFGENVNHRQFIANCDKHFGNILKDSFREHNRLHIAAMVIASIMGSSDWSDYRGAADEDVWRNMAKASLGVADALLAECEKKGE